MATEGFLDYRNGVFRYYGESRYREALALARKAAAKFPDYDAKTSFWIACLQSRLGNYDAALRLFNKIKDAFGVSIGTSALHALILPGEDEEKIRSLHEQSLPILQASKDKGWLGMILASQGDLWLHQPNGEEQAKTLYMQSLRLWDDMRKVDQGIGIVKTLAGIAEMAAAQGQAERAGRLFGVDRMLPPVSKYRAEVDRRVARARAQLDSQSFTAGWNAGRTMTEGQAVNDALKEPLVAAKLA